MVLVSFQGKPFNTMVIKVYSPTSNTEEAEFEQFYEDLQYLLELIRKKDILFIIGDWNSRVVSQETPGVTGNFGLGIQNEAGQRLVKFCQENTLVIVNTRSNTEDSTRTLPDCQHKNHIDYILCSQRWRSSTKSEKNKTGRWLWLISWTPYCKIQTEIEESRENH